MQSSDDNALTCPLCDHKEQICAANQDSADFDFEAAETDDIWNDDTISLLQCGHCAAMIARADGESMQPCPYCAHDALTVTNGSLGVKPDLIAPFRISAAQAAGVQQSWLKRRFLAPFGFTNEYSSGRLQGVYLPYWRFDATAKSSYTGQAGNFFHQAELNTVSTRERTEIKNQRERRVRWRMVSGNYDRTFKDIIFGDSDIDPKVISEIEPFKLSELVKYDAKFAAGFYIERYQAGLKAMWERARLYMEQKLREDMTSMVRKGSNVIGAVNICTHYADIGYKLMLLPLWISCYRFRSKVYSVYINGQTGAIYGRSPVSALKISIIAFALLAAAALFILVL